ncbi:MAG: hypothetical protein CHACPFDD_02046 [Phycisphaerae bacterium]|nr:hypothetical protein [Phycisphaerae bacterium]
MKLSRDASVATFAIATLLIAVAPAAGWNAVAHRIVTLLALDDLPAEAPAWLRDAAIREQIAFQANEADRWRSTRTDPLGHENKPDHYLDIELLDEFGLTLRTMPSFRYEYVQALAIAKHTHPERVSPYDRADDKDRSREWPGFIAHAIAEHYAKLEGCWRTLRILEQLDDPRRAAQLAAARANVLYHMGMLSHFVGDAAQPLHTTRHFNGWTGPNPNGYTTSDKFHSYIDGGLVEHHGVTYDELKGQPRTPRAIQRDNVWGDVLSQLERSHACMEQLYAMEKSGALREAAGRELLVERLSDASTLLSALYWAAYVNATPTQPQMQSFARFDEAGREFRGTSQPAQR